MAEPSNSTVTATAQLAIGDRMVTARFSLPTGRVPLRTVLPVVRALADGVVDAASAAVVDQGKTISCKAGCGACCRQLVPTSQVEAREIVDVVERMPEPRRTQVKGRFDDAIRRLKATGMYARLEDRAQWSEDEFKRVGLEYFHLGIPCPFLEEESCGIHPDRPVTCREYLVTSPAVNCANPGPDNIDNVPLPVKLWREVARFDPVPPGSLYLRWVPLILALEWCETTPEDDRQRPGPEWIGELFQRLEEKVRKCAPAAPQEATAPS
jgi:Fe-S-cluster containining protein